MGNRVTVSFRGEKKRTMDSAVEAYLYLLSHFHGVNKNVFEIYEKGGFKRGLGRRHFAHTEEELFSNPTQRGKPGYSHKINGTDWLAGTHLRDDEKVKILKKLSDIIGLVPQSDWTWE